MFFFETSAKNDTGINNMIYSCIIKLPFFDQFKVDKEIIKKELENNNINNLEKGIFDIDVDNNNNNNNNSTVENSSSNIVLNKNILEDYKKKCLC